MSLSFVAAWQCVCRCEAWLRCPDPTRTRRGFCLLLRKSRPSPWSLALLVSRGGRGLCRSLASGGAACPCLCGVNQGAKGGVACCPLVFPPSEKSSFPLFFLIQHWSHRKLRFASPCLWLVLAGTLFSCRSTPSHFPKTPECVKGAPSASSGDPSVADRMSYRDL